MKHQDSSICNYAKYLKEDRGEEFMQKHRTSIKDNNGIFNVLKVNTLKIDLFNEEIQSSQQHYVWDTSIWRS